MKNKQRPFQLDRQINRHSWFFILPFLIGLALIYLPVVATSLRYSFSSLEVQTSALKLENIGFQNYYQALFEDASFVKTFFMSITTTLVNIPIIIFFSLFVATLLNQKLPGQTLFRAVFFMSAVLLTGVVTSQGMDNALLTKLSTEGGIQTNGAETVSAGMGIQYFLDKLSINENLTDYIMGAVNNIFSIVRMSGVQILIFLAALQSISPALYESAQIEGASGWDCYWKITLPMIFPMLFVNIIYTIIDSFVNPANEVMANVLTLSNNITKAGLASAMAWLYFLLVILLLGIITLFMKRAMRD